MDHHSLSGCVYIYIYMCVCVCVCVCIHPREKGNVVHKAGASSASSARSSALESSPNSPRTRSSALESSLRSRADSHGNVQGGRGVSRIPPTPAPEKARPFHAALPLRCCHPGQLLFRSPHTRAFAGAEVPFQRPAMLPDLAFALRPGRAVWRRAPLQSPERTGCVAGPGPGVARGSGHPSRLPPLSVGERGWGGGGQAPRSWLQGGPSRRVSLWLRPSGGRGLPVVEPGVRGACSSPGWVPCALRGARAERQVSGERSSSRSPWSAPRCAGRRLRGGAPGAGALRLVAGLKAVRGGGSSLGRAARVRVPRPRVPLGALRRSSERWNSPWLV